MYKFLNIHYDRVGLLKLFSELPKASIKSMYQVKDDITDLPTVVELFHKIPVIPHNKFNFELGSINKYVPPYVSPGNNGLVIFPLEGNLTVNFYSYPATRETLSPFIPRSKDKIAEIEHTLISSVLVDRPFAFDGLVPHSYGSSRNHAVIAVLKIPSTVTWLDFCNWSTGSDLNRRVF